MIRALIGVLIAALAAAFIRGLIGMITKEVGQMMKQESEGQETKATAASSPQTGAALRKCKVCETYYPAGQMLEGEFCSLACKEKFRAA